MSKSTIVTLILGIAAATGTLYALGIFDSSTSSVSVKTSAPEKSTATVVTEKVPVSITQKETVTTQTTTQATAPATQSASITKAEVAKHATKNDCFMIISGKVYDLTSYIPMHPAGQGVIVDWCGTDGTNAFVDVRKHWRSNVQAELASYLVGALD